MDAATKQSLDFNSTTFAVERANPMASQPLLMKSAAIIIRMLVAQVPRIPGGPLGSADIFAVLYFSGVMRYQPGNMSWEGRDRFVLSAGHMAPRYVCGSRECGVLSKEEQATSVSTTHGCKGTQDVTCICRASKHRRGSLGQGISIAVGMAMADKLVDKTDKRVFCLTGDGELQEGSIWEAAMSASHFGLDNFAGSSTITTAR